MAKGHDAPDSGIDLLVDLDDGVGLIALAGLTRELSDLVHVHVDVVPADTLKARIRWAVLDEAIVL